MKKYFYVLRITFQEYLTYRLSFILWRFRSFVSLLSMIIFWEAVYGSKTSLFSYSKTQMLSYLIIVAFLKSLILSSRIGDLSGQIRSGDLNKLLLQPVKLFLFWLFRDFADKIQNIFYSIFEILTIVLIFKVDFNFPDFFYSTIIFILMTGVSFFLYFFLNLCLALTAFWTEEIWATRWLFGVILLEFLSGAFFPIDILPSSIQKIIYFTPFPYIIFFPVKIWLNQVNLIDSIKVLFLCSGWMVFFAFLANYLWKKGFKKYGAFGG